MLRCPLSEPPLEGKDHPRRGEGGESSLPPPSLPPCLPLRHHDRPHANWYSTLAHARLVLLSLSFPRAAFRSEGLLRENNDGRRFLILITHVILLPFPGKEVIGLLTFASARRGRTRRKSPIRHPSVRAPRPPVMVLQRPLCGAAAAAAPLLSMGCLSSTQRRKGARQPPSRLQIDCS